MSEIPCAVPGCPHRMRMFTLAWPWRCLTHQAERDQDARWLAMATRKASA